MEESSGLIYLVRHCATRNDAANYPVLLGQKLGMGLSEVGEEHAQQLARYFADKQLSAAYCSPLSRAVRTAQVIIGERDTPLTFCQSFLEADMGSWEGRTYDEIRQDSNDRFDRFLRDPGTYGYPEGENLSEVCRRATLMLSKISRLYPKGRVLVVAHKQTIRAVLIGLQSLPLHRARELEQDPGCINLIRVFRGTMALQAVNWTSSLEMLEEEEEEQCDSASNTTVR